MWIVFAGCISSIIHDHIFAWEIFVDDGSCERDVLDCLQTSLRNFAFCKQQLTNATTVVLSFSLTLDPGLPSHCRDQVAQPFCARGRTSLGALRIYNIIFEERDNVLLSVLLHLLNDR